MTRLVVVGGGITGLAAAWEATHHDGVRTTVIEADDRLGGKIRTSDIAVPGGTLTIDEGADAFLTRVPDAVALCHELGLADQLVHPAVGRARVLVGGELLPYPADHVLGIPLDIEAVAATGILSTGGLDALAAEELRDADAPVGDVAIGPFLTDRFGSELVERLVGPLVGGINAGDVDRLSLAAVTPQLADAAAEGGSLSQALRRRRTAAPDGPLFATLAAGTGRLVDELASGCLDRGVTISVGTSVRSVTADPAGGLLIDVFHTDGRSDLLGADALVVATPAPAAAAILRHISPRAATELDSVQYCSVALTTLVFDRADVPGQMDGSGFLVPRSAGLLMTAVSWGSTKWTHWDDGRHVVLRVSAGHAGDDRGATLDDAELLAGLRADLLTTMGITAEPVAVRVSRWPQGFAQYTVGHLDRVERIERDLRADAPGVRVAGAALRGVGIPACIRQGRDAVRDLLRPPRR